jgi:hypothetical protein
VKKNFEQIKNMNLDANQQMREILNQFLGSNLFKPIPDPKEE